MGKFISLTGLSEFLTKCRALFYTKPSGGIPSSDLASAVQTSLGKADSAYQKPNSGIPKTDLASGVQSSLDLADSSVQANPVGSVTPAVDPYDYATREELSQLGQKVTENTRAIISTGSVAGTSISTIQGYAAGTTQIKSSTGNYYLRLYRIPAYSYYYIKKGSVPGPTWIVAALIDSPENFVVGGNLTQALVWGDDPGTTTHEYYTEVETYLVLLGVSDNELRYVGTANLTLTESLSQKVLEVESDVNTKLSTTNDAVSFIDEGKELRETLSFIRAFVSNAGVVNASTNRVVSKKFSGKEGVLTINTEGASSPLDVIWIRIVSGQTIPTSISNWLTDKCLNIVLLKGYDYYIEFRKHNDATLTLAEIEPVKIYFDKGDIISCNKDANSRLAEMRRPFHNYSSSGTYNPCLTLAYFSDVHADTENIRRMSEFYVKYKWGLDDILQTGDLIAGDLSGGVPSNWNELGANILGVIGNHDAQNKEGGVWVTQPQKDSYDAVFAPWIANWGVTQPSDAAANGYCYWYKDYSGQKIRLIALDCMHWDSTQKDWFIATLADAVTNQLSVVVAVHYLPFEISDTDVPFDSIDFHPTSQNGSFIASSEIPNAVSDFIGNGGEFICYLTGHVHIDLFGVGVSPYGNQLCISIATASYLNTATIYGDTERKQGTKSQDCVNIVSFDTNSKTVKLYRIGADKDRYMRKKDFLSYNYSAKTVIR